MRIVIDDWQLDVDIDATMAYSAHEAATHCDCAYCRNFYAAVDGCYPELRPFLAQFGLDMEAPDELMPYDAEDKMYYTGVYMVCGRIKQAGSAPIRIGKLEINPCCEENELPINHSCPQPCFALDVNTVILPWVLSEPMRDVVSAANDPSFLKRMWQKLILRIQKNTLKA